MGTKVQQTHHPSFLAFPNTEIRENFTADVVIAIRTFPITSFRYFKGCNCKQQKIYILKSYK